MNDQRKILVGASILAKVERGEWPADRALFDLPEKADNQSCQETGKPKYKCLKKLYFYPLISHRYKHKKRSAPALQPMR